MGVAGRGKWLREDWGGRPERLGEQTGEETAETGEETGEETAERTGIGLGTHRTSISEAWSGRSGRRLAASGWTLPSGGTSSATAGPRPPCTCRPPVHRVVSCRVASRCIAYDMI